MKKRQVLIAEDIVMIAEFMKLVLSRHDYRISGVVASGEEAVEAALTTRPDLVLMDIKLDGLVDGIEAAHRIRQNSSIPIVFVSAYTDPAMIGRAMETGAAAYLIKPFKGRDLLAAAERAFEGREAGGRPGEAFTVNHPTSVPCG